MKKTLLLLLAAAATLAILVLHKTIQTDPQKEEFEVKRLRDMLFNMRNDLSEVYSIDLKKDL